MRKAIFTIVVLISTTTNAQYKYHITGTLVGFKDTVEKVYFNYRIGEEQFRESVTVKNGKYEFKGSKSEIGFMTFFPIIKGYPGFVPRGHVALLFVGGGKINVQHKDSFGNYTVSGSPEHAEYEAMQAKLKATDDEWKQLGRAYIAYRQKKDTAEMNEVEKKMDELVKKQKQIYTESFKANPSSALALTQLGLIAGSDLNADELEPLFNLLPETAKNSRAGKDWEVKIDIAKRLGIGKTAPDFTQQDTLGRLVTLSSMRGKYVLLDFWASWCGPCRRENPHLVNVFQKYKGKGFGILSVSLDQPNAKDKWLKAIHDDQLNWTHVSDLKFWNNAAAVLYGIQFIPQNYLLDSEGRIIAKNLKGEDLEKKLGELLK
ncbi:MAG: redoxin domain-containing protein [Chitinophagaceae bacterium]